MPGVSESEKKGVKRDKREKPLKFGRSKSFGAKEGKKKRYV